jgi:hypothetical protein
MTSKEGTRGFKEVQGIRMITVRGNGQENNQVRSEVLGMLWAGLYIGRSMSNYSTVK